MPLTRFKHENPGIWSLSQIILWYKEKRSNLKQINAFAKINFISEGEKSGFEAFLVLNNHGEGRIEALGLWRSPVFSIVFNPDSVYLYIFNEKTLYLCKNKPVYIQKITGMPLDFSLLFDSLVANLPESLSKCPGYFSEEGDHSVFYLSCVEQRKRLKARIMTMDFPALEEITSMGENKHDNFMVKYFDVTEQQGYFVPEKVHFQWPEGKECMITFISFKINQQGSKDIFSVDESWFQGKVINLNGLDP